MTQVEYLIKNDSGNLLVKVYGDASSLVIEDSGGYPIFLHWEFLPELIETLKKINES